MVQPPEESNGLVMVYNEFKVSNHGWTELRYRPEKSGVEKGFVDFQIVS